MKDGADFKYYLLDTVHNIDYFYVLIFVSAQMCSYALRRKNPS